MTLFRRTWRVEIGELVVRDPLRVTFEIERSARPTPNGATVRLYNLNRDHRALIEQADEDTVVSVEAGYVDGQSAQIFLGHVLRARASEVDHARSESEGVDVVSLVEATDAGRAYREARVSRSYEPGVSVTRVLRDCAEALGIGAGNLAEVEGFARLGGGQTSYPEGTTLSGQAARQLSRILRSYGLQWSVQHGALQVTRRGEPLQTEAVRLAPSTGLVGAPEAGTRGRVTATALLTPELWPRRRVALESAFVRGQFLVDAITYRGDSHGNDWYAVLDLRPEQVAA